MVKIKVPQRVKIGAHTYTVKFDTKELLSAGTTGLTKHMTEEIILEGAMPKSQLDQLFLHEVLHMVERYCVVRLEDNEVDSIAEGLAMFLFETLGIELDWSLIKELAE